MSKYGALIEQAKNQKTGLPENQKTKKPEKIALTEEAERPKIKDVNLSIKVPEAKRRHWVSEAKRQGLTITAAVIEALNERFGEPK